MKACLSLLNASVNASVALGFQDRDLALPISKSVRGLVIVL